MKSFLVPQAHMGQHFVRTIGILRAKVRIGMMHLVYNIILLGIRLAIHLGIYLGQLIKRDGISTVRRLPKTQKSQPKFIKNLKNFDKLSCKNKIF